MNNFFLSHPKNKKWTPIRPYQSVWWYNLIRDALTNKPCVVTVRKKSETCTGQSNDPDNLACPSSRALLMGLQWTRSSLVLFLSRPSVCCSHGRGRVVWCSNLTWNLWLKFPPWREIKAELCNSVKEISDSEYCHPDSTWLSYKN